MTIGEVAKTYDVSKDTLRYYIKTGLLIPEDAGKYARCTFWERDIADLELILRMKSQLFSLQEIMYALSLRRTSNMIEPETIRSYKELYEAKKLELREQIGVLNHAIDGIDAEMIRLSETTSGPDILTGVPLRALSLLRCPVCGGSMRLEQADLDSRYVFRGTLHCACGRSLRITDGILETGNLYTGKYDRPDLKRELYMDAGAQFVSYLQKSVDNTCRFLRRQEESEPVIMETHANALFFAYNHLEAVPEGSLYIVTDRFPELLMAYKHLLESLGVQRDFLFIADNSMCFPLKESCVNILVSCMSDIEYSLYETGSYIGEIKPYLKRKAEIIGTFLSFDDNGESQKQIHRKYPEGSALPFGKKTFEQKYHDAGYQLRMKEEGVVYQTNNTGKFTLSCHVPGEALRLYSFHAVPQI